MTSTEHHMARMSTHPVPRIEIVHKPRVYDGHDGAETNPEPWFARFIGANGEEVWRTSESYVDVRDVEEAIALLAGPVRGHQAQEGRAASASRRDRARRGGAVIGWGIVAGVGLICAAITLRAMRGGWR